MIQVAEIDYAIKAPDGKEVEELTKKEIHKALRGKVAIEQMKLDIERRNPERKQFSPRPTMQRPRMPLQRNSSYKRPQISLEQKANFKKMLEDLIGTRGAYLLNQDLVILGKVPITELAATIKNLNSVFAVVFDGEINLEIIQTAERANVKYLVGMSTEIDPNNSKVDILTNNDFV